MCFYKIRSPSPSFLDNNDKLNKTQILIVYYLITSIKKAYYFNFNFVQLDTSTYQRVYQVLRNVDQTSINICDV